MNRIQINFPRIFQIVFALFQSIESQILKPNWTNFKRIPFWLHPRPPTRAYILDLASMNFVYLIDFYCFLLQYSFLLITILLVESTILFCGYWFRNKIEKGFHAAMSNGLQYYGKEPSLSSVVDDIQSTVRYNIFW